MREFSFSVDVAQRYGVSEAILLQNIAFWVEKNRANRKHFHDGHYWTYNSQTALTELFPFWSVKQLRRIVDSCVSQGAILTGDYNTNPMDHTTWYALTADCWALFFDTRETNVNDAEMGKSMCPNGQIDVPKRAELYNEQIVNITDTPYNPPMGEDAQAEPDAGATEQAFAETLGFEKFWIAYPRKVDKDRARRSWKKLKPDTDMVITILRALEVWKQCRQWQDTVYIPHPSTWLNNKRWTVSPPDGGGIAAAAPEPVPREVEEWT